MWFSLCSGMLVETRGTLPGGFYERAGYWGTTDPRSRPADGYGTHASSSRLSGERAVEVAGSRGCWLEWASDQGRVSGGRNGAGSGSGGGVVTDPESALSDARGARSGGQRAGTCPLLETRSSRVSVRF